MVTDRVARRRGRADQILAFNASRGHPLRPARRSYQAALADRARLSGSGGSTKEVRLCRASGCSLFPHRMGSNPWRKEPSPEKRAALGARLRQIKTPDGKGKISEV